MKHILLMLLVAFSLFSHAQTELVNFESAPINVTIDSLTGCWQIGDPQTFYFDTAYSESHALVTDTLLMYGTDSISYAYFSFPTSNLSSNYSISFKHIYFTTPNWEGGYLEFYDCFNGIWIPLAGSSGLVCPAYMVYYSVNGPTSTLSNGEMGFSGISNGWESTEIGFGCAILAQEAESRGMNDNARFRFSFHSVGNPGAAAGWMIDDILFTDFGGICAGISEKTNSLEITVFPVLSKGQISFETESENFSSITIYDFSGKKIELFTFPSTNFHTLQLSKLACGMYFYSVDEGKATGKFMIEK